MNPFEFRGPQFLLFYLALAIVVVAVLEMLRRSLEPGPRIPAPRLRDPLRIACLRGGRAEAIRVATVGLLDRGLLEVEERGVRRVPDAKAPPGAEMEAAILDNAAGPESDALDLLRDRRVDACAGALEAELERDGLLPDRAIRRGRAQRFVLAASLLAGVAGVKIVLALGRGKTNVGFLIMLLFLAILCAAFVVFRRATPRGLAALEDLQDLFARLRASPLGVRKRDGSQEAALAAAVFGMAALSEATWGDARMVFRKASRSPVGGGGDVACGSACGTLSTFSSSSCGAGSSCGSSSCGSSCGGGGGCGGCGGS